MGKIKSSIESVAIFLKLSKKVSLIKRFAASNLRQTGKEYEKIFRLFLFSEWENIEGKKYLNIGEEWRGKSVSWGIRG